MKKKYLWLLFLLVFALPLAFAQENSRPDEFVDQQLPASVIEEFTQPLQNVIQPLVNAAKYILGGIFGLYVFLVLIRIYYERKKVKLLKDIRFDLDHLNKHFDVSHSAHRKGFFGHLWSKIRGRI
ncbi:hypothetical protein HY495_02445 [Candidatus Woesearchaeota archaeon]|nr:hypothetical protein [Candidatus Woesearchaeota archaeon]